MRWWANSSPCHCVESFEKWFWLKPYDRVGASPGAARPVGRGVLRCWVYTVQTGVRGEATHKKAAGCWEMCWNKSDLLLLTCWCHTKHQSSRRVHASAIWVVFWLDAMRDISQWEIIKFCLIRAFFPFKIKIRTEMCPRDIWMCKFI